MSASVASPETAKKQREEDAQALKRAMDAVANPTRVEATTETTETTETETTTTTTTSALDRALQSGKKKNKGKAKKKESYAVRAASTVRAGVSKKRDGAKTSEATAPKYASGNPFAALAMARKR